MQACLSPLALRARVTAASLLLAASPALLELSSHTTLLALTLLSARSSLLSSAALQRSAKSSTLRTLI
jgi:hypothetical protein